MKSAFQQVDADPRVLGISPVHNNSHTAERNLGEAPFQLSQLGGSWLEIESTCKPRESKVAADQELNRGKCLLSTACLPSQILTDHCGEIHRSQ
eukprot:c48301_g1_i1 orf=63-344(+)